jgi:hypothetical protein
MVAAGSFETSIPMYQTRRRNNPQVSIPHSHRRENIKYHVLDQLFVFEVSIDLTYLMG